MAMTHEDFAHICLKIKSGAVDICIPCCATCLHYMEENGSYVCYHPKSEMVDCCYVPMNTDPTDFCNYWEKKDKLPRSCGTCKYVHRKMAAEPCDSCDIHLGLSNWEARDE